MNSEKIREIIDKIPVSLILVGYFLYLGFQYYEFKTDSGSALSLKLVELQSAEKEEETLKKKLKDVNEFVKNIELKKSNVRKLAIELQGMKDALPENIDVPLFMKMLITEAKKVGLTVQQIDPVAEAAKEFYLEVPFKLKIMGAFVQFYAFFDRLSKVTQIVKVENFEFIPLGNQSSKVVALNATLEIKAFKYLGTKADMLGKADELVKVPGAASGIVSGATADKVKDKK